MAKIDNVKNSAVFVISEKHKEDMSILDDVMDLPSLDDTYLDKIKKTYKKQKKDKFNSLYGVDLSQSKRKERLTLVQFLQPLCSFKKISQNSNMDPIASKPDSFHGLTSTASQKRTSGLYNSQNSNAIINRAGDAPLRAEGLTPNQAMKPRAGILPSHAGNERIKTLHQEKNKIKVRQPKNKDQQKELAKMPLPLEAGAVAGQHQGLKQLQAHANPTPKTLQFSKSEHQGFVHDIAIGSNNNQTMTYEFKKWEGKNSVQLQLDPTDKHQVYLTPSNSYVSNHISDHMKEFPSQLKVIIQEEDQRQSKQRNPNENREEKKGKK